jgi:hypothetical protein
MNETDLYESWMIGGSYFNRMIDCGSSRNRWVEVALGYLGRSAIVVFQSSWSVQSSSDVHPAARGPDCCDRQPVGASLRPRMKDRKYETEKNSAQATERF